MSLITSLDLSSSGLTAQRARVENASANLANAQTTRTAEGGPYRRKDVVFQTASFDKSLASAMQGGLEGVEVADVVNDETPFDRRYEPGHPDADAEGYVLYPNVNPMGEMVDLVSAARSYEANLSAANIAKTLIMKTLELGK
jgi:flagellar basal-body rod protein FlgC